MKLGVKLGWKLGWKGAAELAARLAIGIVAITLAARALADGEASSPDALLDRAFQNLYGDDYVQTLELSTQMPGENSMTRKLQITRKQSVRPGKALLRFLEPFEVRKTSVLVLENEGESDDFYVYLPAIRRTRHLSSAQRADSFFGTDLSYEDLEPKQAVDYEVRWADVDAEPSACAVVDIRAKPGFESTYERMVSCIEPQRAVIHWTDFYRGDQRIKRLEIDPADVREVGNRFIPFEMTMTTLKRKSQTRVITDTYELKEDIPDGLFSTWNLEAGDARRDRSRSGS